jgi:hypothetical protein
MGSKNGGIWKFSMKKFGTPIAAGPGNANEKVGFDAEGTPPAVREGGGAGGAALAGWLLLLVVLALPPRPLPDRPTGPGLDSGFGAWLWDAGVVWVGWVLVLVVPVVVVGVLEVLDVVGVLVVGVEVAVLDVVGVLVVGVLVVGVEVVGVVAAGVQDTLRIVAPAGTVGAAPGGRSRLSVCWLPFKLITTTHGSAEAVGSAATPITTNAAIAATTSFRLRGTVVNLLPRVCSSKSWTPLRPAAWPGRYCVTPTFATVNRRRAAGHSRRRTLPVPEPGTGSSSASALRLRAANRTRRRRRVARRDTVAPSTPKGGLEETMSEDRGLKERVVREGEEAIGKLAQQLLENPAVSSALSAAFETRERAVRAQELAMGALNLPSASDLERLTRRLRSVSQRLEGIEDGLDRVEQRIEGLGAASAIAQRLEAIEEKLDKLEKPA